MGRALCGNSGDEVITLSQSQQCQVPPCLSSHFGIKVFTGVWKEENHSEDVLENEVINALPPPKPLP
jgi:hypothetical protein